MSNVYHPLSVMGCLDSHLGSCIGGVARGPARDHHSPTWSFDDPELGTTLFLHNTRPGKAVIHGIRALNPAWEAVILSIGPVRGPFDAAAFNLDAVPGGPAGVGHRYPTPEAPRFVHYPMGFLEPHEKLPVRACPYGNPCADPTLSLLFFVTDEPHEESDD